MYRIQYQLFSPFPPVPQSVMTVIMQ